MLNYELRLDDGILVLRPEGPLAAADLTAMASQVDAYLEQQNTLRGVLIQAKAFPGWKDFGALLAQLKFIKQHHQGQAGRGEAGQHGVYQYRYGRSD